MYPFADAVGLAVGAVDAVPVGLLHHAREGRGLAERQAGGIHPEVVLRCGADAVGAAAEVDDVEVAEEDLVLRVRLLQLDGVAHLLELALQAALGDVAVGGLPVAGVPLLGVGGILLAALHEDVLDVLLADGGAAAVGGAPDVGDNGAHRADEVDAAVLVEVLVLTGQHRVVDEGADLVELHRHAVLVVEPGQQHGWSVVGRVDLGRLHELVDLEIARHVLEHRDRVACRVAADGDGGRDRRGDQDACHGAQADQAQYTAEHTAGRPFLVGHRLIVSQNPGGRLDRMPCVAPCG